MVKEYLKTAVRSLTRNKFHSAINIFGLSVGFAAVLLIFLYLYSEFSYDNFHTNKNELYRVSIKNFRQGVLNGESSEFTPPLGPAILKDVPEVKNYARISTEGVGYLSYNKEPVKVEDIHHADPSVFSMFSFPLLKGNLVNALSEPYSIVLAEQTAKKIFGNQNPLGKTVRIDNKQDYLVTGVAKDVPSNSTIHFNALISFVSLYKDPGLYLDWNGGNRYITFVQLMKNANSKAVDQKLPGVLSPINNIYAKAAIKLVAYLQPITKLHLYYEDNAISLRSNMYIFSFIALFILLIACVNFINLNTAIASKRAKEVGVRKVLGADRKKIIHQFLLEALLLTLVSFVIAVLLVLLSAPLYEQVFGKTFMLPASFTFTFIAVVVLLFFFVGIGIGIYPAFYLSKFEIVRTLKGMLTKEGKPYLRNALVITQFTISIALIASTIIIYQQQQYIRNKKLGFTKDNIVILPLVGDDAQTKCNVLKEQLKELPEIQSISASSDIPHRGFTSNGYLPEGLENPMMIHVVDVDDDFLTTFNISLASGRNFLKEHPADQKGFLINETLANMLGWKDAVGKTIQRDGIHPVIGVVKDFYFASLHDKIEPLIITNAPWQNKFDYLAIHYRSAHTSQLLDAVKKRWQKIVPSTPFDYWFLNDSFNQLYQSEQQFQHGFFYASILAIVLAVLGILGLVSFSIEQRTKEIGIRKVLGASSFKVATLLSKDFLKPVLLANIIAWPLALYFVNKWLQDFANRIEVHWWVFAVAWILSVFIALATVGLQAMKAAMLNPVKNLRAE